MIHILILWCWLFYRRSLMTIFLKFLRFAEIVVKLGQKLWVQLSDWQLGPLSPQLHNNIDRNTIKLYWQKYGLTILTEIYNEFHNRNLTSCFVMSIKVHLIVKRLGCHCNGLKKEFYRFSHPSGLVQGQLRTFSETLGKFYLGPKLLKAFPHFRFTQDLIGLHTFSDK